MKTKIAIYKDVIDSAIGEQFDICDLNECIKLLPRWEFNRDYCIYGEIYLDKNRRPFKLYSNVSDNIIRYGVLITVNKAIGLILEHSKTDEELEERLSYLGT